MNDFEKYKEDALERLEIVKQDLLKQREEIKIIKDMIKRAKVRVPFLLYFLPRKYIDKYIEEKIKLELNENSF